MKIYPGMLVIVLLGAITVAAQEQARQSQQSQSRSISVDVDVIDFGIDAAQVEAALKDRRQLDRMVADGTARFIARAKVRGRSGESVTTRMGQRVPIRSALSPANAQVQYENTGLTLNVNARAVEGDRIEVKLSIDLTGVVRRDNVDPLFVQRAVTDSVLLKIGEPTVLVSVAQNEGLFPVFPRAPGTPERISENFVIVLTARFVD